MQNIQIQNLTAEELKKLISEAVRIELQNNQPEVREETTELLTRNQLAEMLQVTTVTLWKWEKEGIIEPVRFNNQVRYRREDINKTLSDLKDMKYKRRRR